MSSTDAVGVPEINEHPVGPFTGFSNFLRKELLDWWKSWRLIIVFVIPTLIQTLTVFFAFSKILRQARHFGPDTKQIEELISTLVLLNLYQGVVPALFILIIIFSTMGLLTTEKATGTLAWNLTKPLGRTGLLVAKWLVATVIIWVAACVLPTLIASLCMQAYHRVSPDYAKMAPVVGIAIAWIGLWVLLVLTISLGFQSMAAVGGIAIAFWILPFLFGVLLGEILGTESKNWLFDRLATRSPFWAFSLVADKELLLVSRLHGEEREGAWKEVWLYAYAIWSIGLSIFSLRIFNRQEIGS